MQEKQPTAPKLPPGFLDALRPPAITRHYKIVCSECFGSQINEAESAVKSAASFVDVGWEADERKQKIYCPECNKKRKGDNDGH